MAIQVFAKSVTTFPQFEKAVRSSGHQLTDAEVQKAAKQFSVPVADVQQLRTEMLSLASKANDDAGDKSKDLRQQSSFGTPLGLGGQTRIGAPAVAGDVEKLPTRLPGYIDVKSASVLWAGNNNLVMQDSKKNQVALSFDVDNNAHVGFARAGAGDPKSQPLTAELARDLLPLLDLAHTQAPNAQSKGALLLTDLKNACAKVLLDKGAPTDADDLALIDKGAKLFDSGKHEQGEKILSRVADGSAFPTLRAHARFILADMQHRQGNDEGAMALLKLALPSLGQARPHALTMMATVHNASREFKDGVNCGKLAVAEGSALVAKGGKFDLGPAHFALAVAQKNLGDIDDAVQSMTASLKVRPESVATKIALAGYLAIAGKKTEGQALLDSIPMPKEGLPLIDYHTNSMWFHAVAGDKEKTLEFAEKALTAAAAKNFVGTKSYLNVEPDLDWLRKDPDFTRLMSRF